MEIDRWVEPMEVERITGKKLQTLANERYRGTGIPYYKVGASVRYKLADVLSFMERHRIDPEARQGIRGWPCPNLIGALPGESSRPHRLHSAGQPRGRAVGAGGHPGDPREMDQVAVSLPPRISTGRTTGASTRPCWTSMAGRPGGPGHRHRPFERAGAAWRGWVARSSWRGLRAGRDSLPTPNIMARSSGTRLIYGGSWTVPRELPPPAWPRSRMWKISSN